ncbi:PREDICTED: wall-associated receptor kinase-like 1 [Fragaria vesca subsp. vesca]|uniref:wall-associated receptor kinase-like 1 n=1 Tax=Fragaria vesca subsp. vesca TaxID=101020 RepID=UPI0002C3121C|nr:PREDICTED: wall-associated receptor kinase-like 1 [Fragaria vesca subsp. vesca]
MAAQLLFHITLLLWSMSSTEVLVASEASEALPIAKPNCPSHCGDIEIPYPFGIGAGCYINDDWFRVFCDNSTGSPRPYLNGTNLEVLNISVVEGTLRVRNPITFSNCSGKPNRQAVNLEGSPFTFFSQKNMFTAVGCGVMATITSNSNGVTISAGCRSECYASVDSTNSSTSPNTCNGVDCCQTVIPSSLCAFNTSFQQANDNLTKSSCSYAFLVDRDWFESFAKSSTNISATGDMDQVPIVLRWNLYHSTTDVFGTFIAENVTRDYYDVLDGYCESYSDSSSLYGSSRLECFCRWGSEGNPYLLQGCRDINECEDPVNRASCSPGVCVNSLPGDSGWGCHYPETMISKSRVKAIFIGIGSGLGFLVLLFCAWWLIKLWKKRKNIRLKKEFFKQNGGLLLEQQLSSGEVNVEKIKLFNVKELEKATDRFNVDRILGQGGQGTVYKGMLADGRIVAVKKSKIVDGGEVGQFINEIVILSQINHRNVVKLLGCCLETEVPLLVYEFIPKGTIYQYLHEQNEEFPLTWEMRLRISAEVAGALSYLHSAAGFPIYHRDIKTTNILLDDKYRAKVADFGTSRSVSIDQTHLTTFVHGTFGYLDPEYFQSSQFTDKSDVYSFGVVLVELLTGEKPVSLTRSQEARGLVSYFNLSVEENNLFDIIDARVKVDGVTEDILVVANLAKRCLDMNGKRRPTMKEVAMELEVIHKSVISSNTQQNHEEVEYVRNEVTCPWDVATTVTGSALDGGTASSIESLPLMSS